MRERIRAGIAIAFAILLAGTQSLFAKEDMAAKNPVAGVVVLRQNDLVPRNAQKLTTMELGGNSGGYDWTFGDVLDHARAQAVVSGANLIKIDEHEGRSQSNICDRIRATFYKVEDAHAYEHEIAWDRNRKLTWEDFRGPVPADADDITAAATFCGIGFETNTLSAANKKLRIRVYNTFYTTQSWVRPEEQNEQILAHEQGHFDLCELYTRKLRQRLNTATVDVHSLRPVLKSIYDGVQREYKQRQEQYEEETQHGVIAAEQERWQKILEQELSATEALARNN